MRCVTSGLMLASVLVLSGLGGCAKQEAAAPAAPAGFSLSAAEGEDGVMPAQTATVQGGKGYSAKMAVTPIWRVQGGVMNISWYAGLSQTKRFFNISEETGDPTGKPAWLTNPEQGVRAVRVKFDGGAPVAVKPTTTRAQFPTPAGAKAVTEVEVDYGDPKAPQTLTWK